MRTKTLLLCLLMTGAPAMAQDVLPAGPGHDETRKVCGGCHGVDTFTGIRRSQESWETTVQAMINWGATISDADFDTVVTYLTTYFGPNPRPAPKAPAPAP